MSALGSLGAGPVEELIHEHGSKFGDEIDAAARRDDRFRTALRAVWFDEELDQELVNRFRRFGPPL